MSTSVDTRPVTSMDETSRNLAVNLFRYLAELSKLRTPLIRDVKSYDAHIWFSEIPQDSYCDTAAWSWEAGITGDEPWLCIKKPVKPAPPPAPHICLRWYDAASLTNPKEVPTLFEEIPPEPIADEKPTNHMQDEDEDVETPPPNLRLIDHSQVSEEWHKYISKSWSAWREEFKRYERSQAVYKKLFSMFQEQGKRGEQVEVVCGVGTLLWRVDDHRVCRPLITSRVRIEMTPATGELSVAPSSDGGIRFEQDMLSPERQPSPEAQQRVIRAVADLETIWDRTAVEAQLTDWGTQLSADVEVSARLSLPEQTTSYPQIAFAPLLILRKRGGRPLIDMLLKIADQLEEGGHLSDHPLWAVEPRVNGDPKRRLSVEYSLECRGFAEVAGIVFLPELSRRKFASFVFRFKTRTARRISKPTQPPPIKESLLPPLSGTGLFTWWV